MHPTSPKPATVKCRQRRRWSRAACGHGVPALLLGLCGKAEATEVASWLVAAAAMPTAAVVVLAIVAGCVVVVLCLGRSGRSGRP